MDNRTETKLYDIVADEIEQGQIRKGLYAKALSITKGDKPKAQALYIKLRVKELTEQIREEQARHQEQIRRDEERARQEENRKRQEEDLRKGYVREEETRKRQEEAQRQQDMRDEMEGLESSETLKKAERMNEESGNGVAYVVLITLGFVLVGITLLMFVINSI